MPRISRKGGAAQAVNPASVPKERVWNCAVYARLSLEDSGRKGADTIETQIELISSYITQRPNLSLADTYVDNGASGKDFDSPAWLRLMDDVRAGRVDCVVVKDLSRFSRNYIETCEFLEKIFPFMGVRFISVNDGYDNHAPSDRNEGLIIALKSLVNTQYLKDISRKVSSSVKVRRERGDYFGAYAPYGYRRSKAIKGKLEVDEITAPVVRDIFEYRANGMGQHRICALLNEKGIPSPTAYLQSQGKLKAGGRKGSGIWLPTTIKKIIKSQLYLGHVVYGKTSQSLADNKPTKWHDESDWVIHENTHEPVVSRDLWDRANAVSEERSRLHKSYRKGKPSLPKNIFQGLLSCGHCDFRMERTHSHKTNPSGKQYEYYYYGCASPHRHKEGQPTKKIRQEAIYDAVFPLVVDALQKASNLGGIIEKRIKQHISPKAALDAEITRTSQELETINRRQSGLYESYEALTAVVLADIQENAKLAAEDKDAFLKRLHEISISERNAEIGSFRKRENQIKKRLSEIDDLMQKTFEKNCAGLLPDSVMANLMKGYEQEKLKLDDDLSTIRIEKLKAESQTSDISKEIDKLRLHTEISNLNRTIVTNLIKSIHISEPTINGKEKEYEIEIRYKFQNNFVLSPQPTPPSTSTPPTPPTSNTTPNKTNRTKKENSFADEFSDDSCLAVS